MKINFKEGDIIFRKGKKAKIIKIHHTMNPPSVDVMMIETGDYVNTEFSKLSKTNKIVKKTIHKKKVVKKTVKRKTNNRKQRKNKN